ncbi:unnamed protein product [Nesidiocoris tenuis]|uniref:Uncharacterized protein n=1 Tax=Nesidiocoris tenuis TaxID=355587 RepID=A0A6H5HP95_9HEMI|nr:unnamed protein product [Nesidiocoris tenuis]
MAIEYAKRRQRKKKGITMSTFQTNFDNVRAAEADQLIEDEGVSSDDGSGLEVDKGECEERAFLQEQITMEADGRITDPPEYHEKHYEALGVKQIKRALTAEKMFHSTRATAREDETSDCESAREELCRVLIIVHTLPGRRAVLTDLPRRRRRSMRQHFVHLLANFKKQTFRSHRVWRRLQLPVRAPAVLMFELLSQKITFSCAVAALLAVVAGRPQQPQEPSSTPIAIIKYENEGVNYDGSYNWK